MLRFFFFYNLFQEICRNIWSIFFFFFFFFIIRFVNIITSFLFFRSTFSTFSFSRFVHHFVTILFCHFSVQSSIVVVLSTFQSLFFFALRSTSAFNVVTTTKKIMFIVCYISHVNDDFKLSMQLFWRIFHRSVFFCTVLIVNLQSILI